MGLFLGGDWMRWVPFSSKISSSALHWALCWLILVSAVPLDPYLHPAVLACAPGRVLDSTGAPDPVARVVLAIGLLESRAWLEFWVCVGLWWCLWGEGR